MKTGQESGNQNDKSNLNVTNMSSDIKNVYKFSVFCNPLTLKSLWSGYFFELADNGLLSSIQVVGMNSRKWGNFGGCPITILQLLFAAALLATVRPFAACFWLRRVQSGCAMTLTCVGECRPV